VDGIRASASNSSGQDVHSWSCKVSALFFPEIGQIVQILLGKINIKIHGDPSSGSRVVPCGWTDGQT